MRSSRISRSLKIWAVQSARELLAGHEIPARVEGDGAVRILGEAIDTPKAAAAFLTVLHQLVHTALHTALVSIDGGAASAEVGPLDLVDLTTGSSLGAGALHERYVDYLFETGRMT